MKMKNCLLCVALCAVPLHAMAQVENADATGDAKARLLELKQERRDVAKRMNELRQQTLKENPGVANEIKEIDQQIKALQEKKEDAIAGANPEYSTVKQRLEEIRAQSQELQRQTKPKRAPVNKDKKRKKDG